jgi:hypothetical protein
MLEQFYFQLYETEMTGGEVGRAIHFLERASEGKGFYSQVANIIIGSLKEHLEPEEIKDRIMNVEGEEKEKEAIFFRFLYSYNRYDIYLPKYDSKRCDDR